MTAAPKPDLVTVNIDGKEIAVPKGTNAIEAARLVGVDVPYYCYHPKLSVVGNCRMCLIEMGMPAVDPATKAPIMDPATGKQKINWIPRPQIGCATNASPGLHIRTNTPQIKDCREGSLWMKKITTRMVHDKARTEDGALLKSVADQIAGRTICAFGEACSWPTQSFVAKFADEFKAYPQTKNAAKPAGALELV